MPNTKYNLIRDLLEPDRLEVERMMHETDNELGPPPTLTPEELAMIQRASDRFMARLREKIASVNAHYN